MGKKYQLYAVLEDNNAKKYVSLKYFYYLL